LRQEITGFISGQDSQFGKRSYVLRGPSRNIFIIFVFRQNRINIYLILIQQRKLQESADDGSNLLASDITIRLKFAITDTLYKTKSIGNINVIVIPFYYITEDRFCSSF
jgi:hypothetical protein